MRYISIFSGIEAASVAWEPLGFEPVAFSEIDPFPSAVLKQRFPSVPNLGDITKVDWSVYHGSIDIVAGGSPCQSFSIAGKREGLSGASGLMFEYIRCIQEIMPRYFIWENVPGALSSENGEAFRQLLREMDEFGYSLAWRVLDAQFFGVAQKRRRVFLIGSIAEGRAAEILFERESMYRDPKAGRGERKRLTANVEGGVGGGCEPKRGCMTYSNDPWGQPAYTAVVRCGKAGGGKGALVSENVSMTLATANTQTLFQPKGGAFVVRRLTPIECERLQGFPDNWTAIDYKGKPANDAPRYKALGNSMAVPVMRWIGERVQMVSDMVYGV